MRVLALRPAAAVASDAIAIVVFAVVGLLSHRGGVSAAGLARDVLPLLGGWLAAAALVGLYVRPAPQTLAATWLAGIAGGVVVRALVLGHHTVGKEASFLGVSLTFTLLFVLAARLLAARAIRRVQPS